MSNDSFQRWQDRTIEQLGRTSNLIIGLAGGGLALTITVLREDKPILTCFDMALLYVYSSALVLSIAAGLLVTVNRLDDFRLTAQIARNRTKQNYTPEQIEDMRADSRAYGKWTWRFFVSQLILFTVGAVVYVFFLWHVIPR